jgi:hypothetical protein
MYKGRYLRHYGDDIAQRNLLNDLTISTKSNIKPVVMIETCHAGRISHLRPMYKIA